MIFSSTLFSQCCLSANELKGSILEEHPKTIDLSPTAVNVVIVCLHVCYYSTTGAASFLQTDLPPPTTSSASVCLNRLLFLFANICGIVVVVPSLAVFILYYILYIFVIS